MNKFKANNDALYFTDNGAIYCGEHLGMTAKYTGRDISGQKIDEITPDSQAAEWLLASCVGCETCGKRIGD